MCVRENRLPRSALLLTWLTCPPVPAASSAAALFTHGDRLLVSARISNVNLCSRTMQHGMTDIPSRKTMSQALVCEVSPGFAEHAAATAGGVPDPAAPAVVDGSCHALGVDGFSIPQRMPTYRHIGGW